MLAAGMQHLCVVRLPGTACPPAALLSAPACRPAALPQFRGHTFNAVDTPGHADFGGEVRLTWCRVSTARLMLQSATCLSMHHLNHSLVNIPSTAFPSAAARCRR